MKVYSITTNSGIKYFVLEDGKIVTNDVRNVGSWVMAMGGIDSIVKKSVLTGFDSLEQAADHRKELLRKNAASRLSAKLEMEKQIEEEYQKLLDTYDVIPSTAENIKTVLSFLNTKNWGSWDLPKMEIGYSCHQYDCEGYIVSTMVLDRPIEYRNGEHARFKHGFHPRGHLDKYIGI